ncbi:N-6 DNA methylase [Clostridium sp. MD294]|uniref:N-6 DNA methylase n=1 Tax=Clostridium sp. MD294 TaxID=97138 RepID=UPI0003A230CC|nr:N-6 DNA methylase [Clostridium sp. MD294]
MHIISNATKKNWNKLHTKNNQKLTTRANKCLSQKNIIPLEYFCNTNNIKYIQNLLYIVHSEKWNITSILLSLGINLLKKANLYHKKYVQNILKQYPYAVITELLNDTLPNDEIDILGIIYQCLLTEGQKNITGSYYTPHNVVKNMTHKLDFSKGQTFFDPCCGSGAFLLSLNNIQPKQLYGMDKDNIAVMIAKINLLLKFRDYEFEPQIYCGDYLKQSALPNNAIFHEKFDYIVTNPPWGAASQYFSDMTEITSRETFSYFFVRAFQQLKQYGTIRFLFPEAILNVKKHKDIRTFLLEKGCFQSITFYKELFTDVTTKYIDINFQKAKQSKNVLIYEQKKIKKVPLSFFYKTENKTFRIMADIDIEIIEQVKKYGKYNLNDSIWALGIVTGDNKNKLKEEYFEKSEVIYTGKEICHYVLKPAKKYIIYDRTQLQQVAPEKYYRAEEKLVYKFISKKLVFAYDNTKSLFLNSANILIPSIHTMSIKTVMAYLNSELFQYLYSKMFGQVKILKGNLILLPFPQITQKQNNDIIEMVNEFLKGDYKKESILQDIIFQSYQLNAKQIKHIKKEIL